MCVCGCRFCVSWSLLAVVRLLMLFLSLMSFAAKWLFLGGSPSFGNLDPASFVLVVEIGFPVDDQGFGCCPTEAGSSCLGIRQSFRALRWPAVCRHDRHAVKWLEFEMATARNEMKHKSNTNNKHSPSYLSSLLLPTAQPCQAISFFNVCCVDRYTGKHKQ